MYLFLDTETTGFPSSPISDFRSWPRMVQIGYILTDEVGKALIKGCKIIKPEGYLIPKRVSEIHKITTEKALNDDVPLDSALKDFIYALQFSSVVVGHNVEFDYNVVRSELLRRNLHDYLRAYPRFCTMKSKPILNYCKIMMGNHRLRWSKLQELYSLLFHQDLENAHDALGDAEACAKCFFELKKLCII
jgi:DNA polymerase III epsilon subunit-like protein